MNGVFLLHTFYYDNREYRLRSFLMKRIFTVISILLSLMVMPFYGFASEINGKTTPFEDETIHPKQAKQSVLQGKDTDAATEKTDLTIEAEAYYLMDYNSGIVLAAKNEEQQRPPASMTKMMTAYIVLEKIQKGELHWTDKTVVSKRAADINEAQIYLQPNEEITIKELFTGLLVQSANDAAVVLAEHVAGSEEAFVQLMNQKAKELGLKHTHFRNSSGLNQEDYPDPPDTPGEHVMPAKDTAQLATQLITNYPEVFSFTTIANYTFHKGTPREQTVTNWNSMLPGLSHEYKGVQGIKTGSTQLAGFCFAGTVIQKDTRFVSVVMGTASKEKRFTETKKLYDYGYQLFQPVTLLQAGQSVPNEKTISLAGANEKKTAVILAKNIRIPMPKSADKSDYSYHVVWKNNKKAPLKKGTVVGKVELLYRGQEIDGFKPIPLVTKNDVQEENFFDKISHFIAS
jgi:D-alanyl-D-alanine carboxypeptidase (penicillin-binding protein 5/6)